MRALIKAFKAWRERRYWEKRHLEFLKNHILLDWRWLGVNPIGDAFTSRYKAMVTDNWYKREHEPIQQFRRRIGMDPNSKQENPSENPGASRNGTEARAAFQAWLSSVLVDPNDVPAELYDTARQAWEDGIAWAQQQEWKGLTESDKNYFVDELIGYGTGFVAPLYAVVDQIAERLRERNSVRAQRAAEGNG